MGNVVIKALSFIIVIIIGYSLRRKDVFKGGDIDFLNKLIMNVTLPCALISGFQGVELTGIMIACIFIGISLNIIMILVSKVTSRDKGIKEKSLCTLNMAGYNIGNFILPFAQVFLPPSALAIICMFDSGNAIMTLGGTYSYTCFSYAENKDQFKISDILKKLLKSIPFDVYICLLILTYLNISLPSSIIDIISFIGGSNAFLAMLMIGMMIELKIDKKGIKLVSEIIAVRYIMAIIFSLIIYYVLPFTVVVKQALTICCFAPIASVTPMFSKQCGCDESIVAIANSICIIISIIFIVSLLLFMI